MNNLRKIRTELGITMTELASLTNLSVGYICHLEKGSRINPSYAVMKKVAQALHKEIFDIFT